MHYIVLFLCTGNSAGSIMAEAILDSKGAPDFRAYSAASLQTGSVRTEVINLIQQARLPIDGLRSKSWNEIARPGAPKPDFVFPVCDKAAQEVCRVWPGQPTTAHWGVPDPAAVNGSLETVEKAFRDAFLMVGSKDQFVPCSAHRKFGHTGDSEKYRSPTEVGISAHATA